MQQKLRIPGPFRKIPATRKQGCAGTETPCRAAATRDANRNATPCGARGNSRSVSWDQSPRYRCAGAVVSHGQRAETCGHGRYWRSIPAVAPAKRGVGNAPIRAGADRASRCSSRRLQRPTGCGPDHRHQGETRLRPTRRPRPYRKRRGSASDRQARLRGFYPRR
jgi:hypothetical protein